ncbi:MAG: tRNA adenosine(34) deaminase TadA [Actinomycetota bacterium]|nr:tRNA adenosine(34) deaminase TadA [Actinomycetota bacterium]
MPSDEECMRLALVEAALALEHDDVPIGAVLLSDGQVVASAHNERQLRGDPTAHAEVLALRAAAGATGSWRLEDTTMYVSLEPCAMCAGALVLARVHRLVYGPQDPLAGAALSLYNIVQDPRLNHELEVTYGVLSDEGAELITDFFERRRHL